MKILCEEAGFVVCEKPAGTLSQEGPGRNMPDCLREQLGKKEVYPVHRLDTAAQGLMVFALNGECAAKLSRQIADGLFEKEYLCVVHGSPDRDEGEYEDLLFRDQKKNKSYIADRQRKGVKQAKLMYKVLSAAETGGETLSLVRVKLMTGRTHQIRVQFASRGTPLAGDGKYGARDNLKRLALYSCRLGFAHPETGERLVFESEPPDEEPWRAFN